MSLLLKLWFKLKKQLALAIERQLNDPSALWIFLTFLFSSLFWLKLLLRKKKKIPLKGLKICVGNITIGGNGKTPFLIQLAKDLNLPNQVVVSKGYKREKKGTFLVTKNMPWQSCGDEPWLVNHELENIPVFVTDSRLKFIQDHPYACYLFDDGLHESAFDYEIKIALFDKKRFFQKKYLLPTGIFRDQMSSLKDVDLIAVKGKQSIESWNKITDFLKQKKIDRPLINFSLKKVSLVNLKTGHQEIIDGKTAVFCGIGNPKSFIETLQDEKIDFHQLYTVLDHETLSTMELMQLFSNWKKEGIMQVVMTKKDAIKIKDVEKLPLPIFYVETALKIERGHLAYQDLLNQINKKFENLTKSDQYGK
jgi:tetraacyldisaccharide 4'-kinase